VRIEKIEIEELSQGARRMPVEVIVPAPPRCSYGGHKLLAYKINADGVSADLYLEDDY
jgi:hypothetical protein